MDTKKAQRAAWSRARGLRCLALAVLPALLTACGTLTGLPGHGGGKRFATEQRLVSASIRHALKSIDVSPLRGKKVAVVFDIVSDEGGGNIVGGRMNLAGVLSAGVVNNPATTSSSAFQVFNLTDSASNFSNTAASTSSTADTTATTNATSNYTGSSSSAGTTSTTGTSTLAGTSNSSSSGTSGSNTTTDATTESFSQSGTTSGTGSSSVSTDVSSNTTSSGNTSGNTNTATSSTGSQSGGSTTNRQVVSNQPSKTVSRTEGRKEEAGISAAYKGLGDYQNFSVPKSDASLLMGLVRNYLLLNHALPTTPTDKQADILLYVSVDIFGLIRSRFDALIYNQENVKAETALEMTAYDRKGRIIMRPRVASSEASYKERYVLWAGPFATTEQVQRGPGLLVDFTDVGETSGIGHEPPTQRLGPSPDVTMDSNED